MDTPIEIRRCLHCAELLPERSRSDRKFCPQKFGIINYCKNAYHNPITLSEYHEHKGLRKINKLNRDILKQLLGNNETRTISESELVQSGFRLEFIINKAQMRTSKNEAFLYLDYGLELLGNSTYKIFKHGRRF